MHWSEDLESQPTLTGLNGRELVFSDGTRAVVPAGVTAEQKTGNDGGQIVWVFAKNPFVGGGKRCGIGLPVGVGRLGPCKAFLETIAYSTAEKRHATQERN